MSKRVTSSAFSVSTSSCFESYVVNLPICSCGSTLHKFETAMRQDVSVSKRVPCTLPRFTPHAPSMPIWRSWSWTYSFLRATPSNVYCAVWGLLWYMVTVITVLGLSNEGWYSSICRRPSQHRPLGIHSGALGACACYLSQARHEPGT